MALGDWNLPPSRGSVWQRTLRKIGGYLTALYLLIVPVSKEREREILMSADPSTLTPGQRQRRQWAFEADEDRCRRAVMEINQGQANAGDPHMRYVG